jgi:HlyD family secretion protein
MIIAIINDMDSNILEDQDLKNCAEDLFGSLSRHTRILYDVILLLLVICGILMTLVQVPVSVEFRGTLRPASEKKPIYSCVNGTIKQIFVEENHKVRSGRILLILDTSREIIQLGLIHLELKKIKDWMKDCDYIINNEIIDPDLIGTPRFRTEYLLSINERKMTGNEMRQAETDFYRYRSLIRDSLISQKEMEEVEFHYSNISGKMKSLIHSSKNRWLEQLELLKQKELSLSKEKYSLEQVIKDSEIRSPVSGTVQGIRNIFPGYYCTSGIHLFDVIPDTILVAEMYIPSEKIGFIQPGMKAKLKIDAFDYKYWGSLESHCVSISHDYDIIENQPYFRVICRLEEPLKLSFKGKSVNLKPGMTLSSRFVLNYRTVWQLFKDRSDAWISDAGNL